MNDPQDMMAAYFEGTLTADEVAELEAWLREDRERARAFVRQAMLDCNLAELLHEENVENVTADLSDDSQFGTLLHDLDAPSDSGGPINITETLRLERLAKAGQADNGSLSSHDLKAVGGYLLRHALTPRRLAYAGVAAALVLAAALIVVLLPGQNESPEIAAPPTEIIHPAPAVATLTNTHNAQWAGAASAAPAPGDTLRAGQTLTLTAGFAEITTARGAIAILQAPASIELTDNDNALRLHTGKLIGICETETSKGFVVRTPHMDITDLGTRFGVGVDTSVSTVQVIQGSVRVDQPNVADKPLLLSANEAVTIDDQGQRHMQDAEQSGKQFARLLQQIELGQPQISGSIRFHDQAPDSIDYDRSPDNDHLQLFREQSGVELTQQTLIDITEVGAFNSRHYTDQPGTLPGKRVTSYMLYASVKPAANRILQLSATITFEGEIVGLIGTHQSLQQSDASLGLPSVDYSESIHRSMLKDDNNKVDDQIQISEDRRTLTIDCRVAGIDQLRILVQPRLTRGVDR